MGIVDLHDVELLDDLRVDLKFTGLELRNDGLTQVDCYYVIHDIHRLNFFFSLQQIKNDGINREYVDLRFPY